MILNFLCLLVGFAHAEVVHLTNPTGTIKLGPSIEIMKQGQWTNTKHQVPNFGFTLKRKKARIRIQNPFNELKAYIEHRYVHTDSVTIMGLSLGDRIAGAPHILPAIYPLFPIRLKTGLNVINVEVTSQEIVTLPLYLRFSLPDRNFDWLLIGCTLSLLGMILLLCLIRTQATYFYSAYVFFYIINHLLIEGLPKKYFPNLDWSFVMNEGYFYTALAYQLCLLASTYYLLAWRCCPKYLALGFKILGLSSIGLMLALTFMPYHLVVIPYFTNAGLILVGFVVALIYQMIQGHSTALWVSLTWLPSGIALTHSLYLFLSHQYIHSFGYIIGGMLQIWLMIFVFFKKNNRPVVTS